jgi:hypothetical protein
MDALLRRLLRCFGARRRRERPRRRHGGRGGGGRDDDADDATKKSFLRRVARFGRRGAGAERLETPRPCRRRWPRPRGVNRVFARSPPCGTAARGVEPRPAATDAVAAAATAVQAEGGGAGSQEFSVEHAAAATIQAHFRGHLVRA